MIDLVIDDCPGDVYEKLSYVARQNERTVDEEERICLIETLLLEAVDEEFDDEP